MTHKVFANFTFDNGEKLSLRIEATRASTEEDLIKTANGIGDCVYISLVDVSGSVHLIFLKKVVHVSFIGSES